LHGDLWSGNFMSSGIKQTPTLFDPAVYFGHREVDLAFSKMFGGFAPEFYAAYREEYPLEAGFDDRVPYYNLYPLLVHVNLFGGSYITQFTHFLRTI
jgi:protein-ribulosamine 3-kinase